MLLIEPPLSSSEWARLKAGCPRYEWLYADYCNAYESAVLSLPDKQIDRIVDHLMRDLEDAEVTPEALQLIIERELGEEDFEASGKVAKIVVLCALGQCLGGCGCPFSRRIRRLLQLCEELVPVFLMLAVDDHFGTLVVGEG
jgi:hypothetical protein